VRMIFQTDIMWQGLTAIAEQVILQREISGEKCQAIFERLGVPNALSEGSPYPLLPPIAINRQHATATAKERRVQNAHHNAGHLVADHLLNLPAINAADNGNLPAGRNREGTHFDLCPLDAATEELKNGTIADFASVMAENRFMGRPAISWKDFKAAFIFDPGLSATDRRELKTVLNYLWTRTAEFFQRPCHWRATQDVAAEFLKHGRLTEDEITRLISEAFASTLDNKCNSAGESGAVHMSKP
jgi:hypothetical protein